MEITYILLINMVFTPLCAQTPPRIGDIEQCSDELIKTILESALTHGNTELYKNVLDHSGNVKPAPLVRANSEPVHESRLKNLLDKKLNKTTDS